MESCPLVAQCICCGEVVFFRDLADAAADVCINCFGGGDEDLEEVRQKVEKKKKLNEKPAQAAGKMAGKGVKKKASASNRAASKETASASNRAMLK